MGAVANLTAAGAIQAGHRAGKYGKMAAAQAFQQETLLAAVANEMAESNRLQREANALAADANRHAVALVNEQMRTNQLLQALLAKGA